MMIIKTMLISETTEELNRSFEKMGWKTWENGTIVKETISKYKNNGGWKDLKTFQKSRLAALRNHPKEKATAIKNGVRVVCEKQFGLRRIQEITMEN